MGGGIEGRAQRKSSNVFCLHFSSEVNLVRKFGNLEGGGRGLNTFPKFREYPVVPYAAVLFNH
jgi:hypothetical protein